MVLASVSFHAGCVARGHHAPVPPAADPFACFAASTSARVPPCPNLNRTVAAFQRSVYTKDPLKCLSCLVCLSNTVTVSVE